MIRLPQPQCYFLLLTTIAVIGCSSVDEATPKPKTEIAAELNQRVEKVLEFTLQKRQLNTIDHGAWQVMHGVLAFQLDFPIRVGRDGLSQPAVEYLLNGGTLDGWSFRPGTTFSDGRTGLRAIMEPGTKRGQGHSDQWLAILAQCGLPESQEIRVDGKDFKISDLILQVQYDVPNNRESEYSWTLIGLTLYLPTSAKWIAADQTEWSIERLVQIELEQNLNDSACGGTHRLIGIAMALNSHLAYGGKLEGVWLDADQAIQQAVQMTKDMQNSDGSLSSNYFARSGRSADMATTLSTTGHLLEFLTLALKTDDLKQPWVEHAAARLCYVFDELNHVAPECGALYHAAHGLALYRKRVES